MEYAPNFGGAHEDEVDPLLPKELPHSGLIEEIQFGVRPKDEVGKPIVPQATNDSGPYQAPVTSHKDASIVR